MQKNFSLSQLSEMSMLTQRTLHNYMKRGLLHGEKTASGWRFSDDEVARFWAQPFVSAAVNSRQLGIADDFLSRGISTSGQILMVYDYETKSPDEAFRLCEYFLSAVKQSSGMRFAYRYDDDMMRVTLRGNAEEVMTVMNGAFQKTV